MRRKTNDEFIKEMGIKHPFLKIIGTYINQRSKVQVQCLKCGDIFWANPGSLHMGNGCANCKGLKRKNTQQFINELLKINPNIKVCGEYVNNKTKLLFVCKLCGYEWTTTPNAVLSGRGCAKCAGLLRKTQEEFEKQMRAIHPYIKVVGNYDGIHTKVECKCTICNHTIYSSPHNLLTNKNGCRFCRRSRGEIKIQQWLDSHGLEYIKEYMFDDCCDVRALPFDFYIQSLKVAIEYDGKQHYEPNRFFGGIDGLVYTQKHDSIKNQYCKDNNIRLIRIPYWENKNINKILDEKLVL